MSSPIFPGSAKCTMPDGSRLYIWFAVGQNSMPHLRADPHLAASWWDSVPVKHVPSHQSPQSNSISVKVFFLICFCLLYLLLGLLLNICQPQIYSSTFMSEERFLLWNMSNNPLYPVGKYLYIKGKGGVNRFLLQDLDTGFIWGR